MDISIVVTAYNYERYVGGCLQSCLNQSPHNLLYEVVVVDDGSTDATPTILDQYRDPKLRWYRTTNGGIERASNFGFAKALGKFIVRVDADDLLSPDFLRRIEPYLGQGHPFIYGDYDLIDAEGSVSERIHLPEFDADEIRSRGDFLATGTLYDAGILSEFSGYDTATRNCGLENYELVLKLLRAGYRGKHVRERLFSYRRHPNNVSSVRREAIVSYGRSLFERLELGVFRTNEYHPYQLRIGET